MTGAEKKDEENEKVMWKKCGTNGKSDEKEMRKNKKNGRRDGHDKNKVMLIKIIQQCQVFFLFLFSSCLPLIRIVDTQIFLILNSF